METIKSYLDNVFSALPETTEILDLKNELLNNMIDKYDELKASGKADNEAIGIIISEFGNIDELLQEMDITIAEKAEVHTIKAAGPIVSLEEATRFIDLKYKTSRLLGSGVALILIGASLLVGLVALIENQIILQTASTNLKDVLPVTMLFLFIAPAVALFIIAGSKLEEYKFIEEGRFELGSSAKAILAKDYPSIKAQQPKMIIAGVSLCLLSPIVVIISSSWGDIACSFGVCILLLMIAMATYVFIRSGSVTEGYKKLLKLDEFSPERKEENKIIGAVAGIIWPLAVCIFLVAGLVFDRWDICWIVFPITGILFGGFCAFHSIIHKH